MRAFGAFLCGGGIGCLIGYVIGCRNTDREWNERLKRMAQELRRMGHGGMPRGDDF